MQDFEKLGVFYLGKKDDGLLLLDSKDLVTHAVCVGMTGSGKTGLCIGLLEEAAIDGIPALIIDPKGDLSNLLLNFPNLAAEDFVPWVNEEEAKKKGETREQFAAETADKWKKGLADWGQDGARIQRLRDAADFTIFTPGSSAGFPVSVLRSFSAPPEEMREDREAMRERIQSTATALLALMNITAGPIQSREHILISKLIENAWMAGNDLDLATLIQQIQKPPVTRIGVLEIEAFFPSKERFDLAIALNNLLASPGFEAWLEGDSLDIGTLLYTAQGRPRMSIFSISHLSDSERMFFVALLMNQMVSWMRTQPGTSSLRALLYMDEIFGYFPPVANPPSKQPLLTLLKQARAFGVGIVLATQNPVDLDYKGLANCGTWLIGRLQTERDRARLIEGLEGAAAAAGGSADRGALEKLLSSLKSRIFLMSNVHRGALEVFESRWALSFLSGPLTKAQVKTLMGPKKKTAAVPAAGGQSAAAAPPPKRAADVVGTARPVLPPDIEQHFLPVRATGSVTYEPVLLGVAQVRFTDTKTKVDHSREVKFCTLVENGPVNVNWEQASDVDIDLGELESAPMEGASFGELPASAGKVKSYTTWNKDFVNWLFATQKLVLMQCANLNTVSNPDESERDFRVRLSTAAHEARDEAVAALRQKYGPKLAVLEERIRKAQQMMEKQQQEAAQSKVQSGLSIATTVLGAIMGRGFMTKTAMTGMGSAARTLGRASREGQDVDRAEENLHAALDQKTQLEQQLQEEIAGLAARYDTLNEKFQAITIAPKKTNIQVKLFSLCWRA
ncbi:MAG: ATP-binding protein [Acidobacteria bacterium]|nr:ATP-binding protein [Acidobacteriota bacterium]